MEDALLLDLTRQSLLAAVQLAAPVLACVLVVSLLVSLLQSATQMHDPTASAVPRLAAAAVAVIVFGPWMIAMLLALTTDLWINIPRIIR